MFTSTPGRRPWPEAGLDAMVAALEHRGPDGSGKYVEDGLFLGHTRLAVLDLSQAGRQPMQGTDGRFVISYNGEIYNFRTIRSELESMGYSFQTQTDTEVLLGAWAAWGEGALAKLDGIFAFAIYDRREHTLFLVRDHLGIKPLFYWHDAGEIAFASEPLAMFGPIIPVPDPDPVALDSYFTFNYLPAPASGLQNVRQLPPGHILRISPQGKKSLAPYWQLKCRPEPLAWRAELVDEFYAQFSQAVKNQLVSDAPLGLFLSGGLDSTAVAIAAHEAGATPNSYTLGFAEAAFNEAPTATSFANSIGLRNESITFAWNEEQIRETLNSMRELLADSSCFPLYQLARFAKSHATVILAGDGCDELLAGYDTYRASQLTPIIRKIPALLRRAALAGSRFLPCDDKPYSLRMVAERLLLAAAAGPRRDHASFRQIFYQAHKKRLYVPDFFNAVTNNDPIGDYVQKMAALPAERSQLTGLQVGDLGHFMPSVLAKVDRMSMACGLEVRVPFLNRKLVEFCFQLPDEAKRFQGKGKRLLREAIADKVPSAHLTRPKTGFLPPVDSWFRNPGPMRNVFNEHLDWAKSNQIGWLDWAAVETSWLEHKSKKSNSGFVLLGILQFINWQKQLREIRPCDNSFRG